MVVSLANKPYSITQPASLKIIKSQNWQLILKPPHGPTAWPNPGFREFPVVFFSGTCFGFERVPGRHEPRHPQGPPSANTRGLKKSEFEKKHVGIQWLRSVLAPKFLQVKFLAKENRLRMASNKTKIPGKMRRIASAEAGTSKENLFECA